MFGLKKAHFWPLSIILIATVAFGAIRSEKIYDTGLTALRLVSSAADQSLESVGDLTAWVLGTANEIETTDNGDGTVTVGIVDSPTIDGTNFTNISADDVNITDSGDIVTATEVEGALQEHRTAIDLNTTHRGSDGSDHTFIDQSVVSGSSPTFDGTNFTGVPVGGITGTVPIASGGTNSSTALNNDRVMVSDTGAIIESATITTTEIGLLNGMASVSTGAGDNDKLVTQGYVDDSSSGVSGAAVLKSLFDANTILSATVDDTPAAMTVAEQTLVGRITAGNITDLTATEVRTLLNVEDGSEANNISDVNATDLTDTGNTALHTHDIYALDTDIIPQDVPQASSITLGTGAGAAITSATGSTLLGYYSGNELTEATSCTFVGTYAGRFHEDGDYCTFVGGSCGSSVGGSIAPENSALGYAALYSLTTGGYNTTLGRASGFSLTSGDSNLFLGYYAGFRQTTLSDLLIIDNQQRADAATEITNSIMYGVMAALPADQTLRINAVTTMGDGSKLLTDAAPTADAEIANKKYVDDTHATPAAHAMDSHSDIGTYNISTTGGCQVGGVTIFNSQYGDVDFHIRKDTADYAYIYDAGDDTHTFSGEVILDAITTKDPPLDADKVIYRDSTDSDRLVTSTWTQVKAFLKTYFDGLYSSSSDLVNVHKGRMINDIYGLATAPANIKLFSVMDETGAVSAISDKSTIGGTTAHTIGLKNDSLAAINASTCSPGVSGVAPSLTFDATHLFQVADASDLSFALAPFSIVQLLNVDSLASNSNILAKYDATTGSNEREIIFQVTTTGLVKLLLYDETAGGRIGRESDTGEISAGSWITLISTYDGGTVNSGIKLYKDSVQIDTTDASSGTFNSIQDTAANCGSYILDSGGSVASPATIKSSVTIIISEELSQTQINRIDAVLRSYVGEDI